MRGWTIKKTASLSRVASLHVKRSDGRTCRPVWPTVSWWCVPENKVGSLIKRAAVDQSSCRVFQQSHKGPTDNGRFSQTWNKPVYRDGTAGILSISSQRHVVCGLLGRYCNSKDRIRQVHIQILIRERIVWFEYMILSWNQLNAVVNASGVY